MAVDAIFVNMTALKKNRPEFAPFEVNDKTSIDFNGSRIRPTF